MQCPIHRHLSPHCCLPSLIGQRGTAAVDAYPMPRWRRPARHGDAGPGGLNHDLTRPPWGRQEGDADPVVDDGLRSTRGRSVVAGTGGNYQIPLWGPAAANSVFRDATPPRDAASHPTSRWVDPGVPHHRRHQPRRHRQRLPTLGVEECCTPDEPWRSVATEDSRLLSLRGYYGMLDLNIRPVRRQLPCRPGR
jgi:hypothetical protein